jgi:hypothetical protein
MDLQGGQKEMGRGWLKVQGSIWIQEITSNILQTSRMTTIYNNFTFKIASRKDFECYTHIKR